VTAPTRAAPLAALLVACATGLAACSGCGDNQPADRSDDDGADGIAEPDAGTPFTECDGTDQSFVRQATLALLGRRPHSQAEVDVYTDLMAEVRAARDDAGPAPADPPPDPREVVARALVADPGFADRWSEHVMDALQVPRIEDQTQRSCYGVAARADDQGIADGSLAQHVRDDSPRGPGDGGGRFTMLDLLRSALALDDLSVVYRAHLYALVSRPIPAANVPPVEAELARREDFGLLFDATYLNRDLVCLGCHNSESSVTYSPEPALSRHWPMPGFFEAAIYGSPTGIDAERAHAAFRFTGFVADPLAPGEVVRPWEWDAACGSFDPDGLAPDPAGVDGKLASLSGDLLTVFDLDEALRRGFDSLASGGLVIDDGGAIADPDAAMAFLVAATIVEGVWREVIGTPLTIANYFPRNQAARDLLTRLTTDFVASRYSLRELLVDIVTSDYFDRLPPEAGCGAGPYDMPAVYDPWVTSDPDPARRANGPGDAVAALSPRVVLRAAYDALEWSHPPSYEFPEDSLEVAVCLDTYTCEEMAALCRRSDTCCEAYQQGCVDPPGPGEPTPDELRAFERGIGIFLKRGERGFRGLDFQARLVFEDAFGGCASPGDQPDFVADLVARARSTPDATVGDVVAALKDRLVGDAHIDDQVGASGASERGAIESIFAADLSTVAADVDDLEARTRSLCGVLLSSPLFLLGGVAAPDSSGVPMLTPESASYAATCSALVARSPLTGFVLTCGDSLIEVSRTP